MGACLSFASPSLPGDISLPKGSATSVGLVRCAQVRGGLQTSLSSRSAGLSVPLPPAVSSFLLAHAPSEHTKRLKGSSGSRAAQLPLVP